MILLADEEIEIESGAEDEYGALAEAQSEISAHRGRADLMQSMNLKFKERSESGLGMQHSREGLSYWRLVARLHRDIMQNIQIAGSIINETVYDLAELLLVDILRQVTAMLQHTSQTMLRDVRELQELIVRRRRHHRSRHVQI